MGKREDGKEAQSHRANLTKGQRRKLGALRKSVGDEIATRAFAEWFHAQQREQVETTDKNAELLSTALAPLIERGQLRIRRGGYLVRRGRGRVIVEACSDMTGNDDPIDLEQALLDPAAVFSAPEAVPKCSDLTREQKIEILRRWEYDARAMEVAEEENVGESGQTSDLLSRVLDGLHALDAAPDLEHSPPTKHGGV